MRPAIPKLTIEDTDRLLKETILKRLVTEPDMTVAEFVTRINEAIQASGTTPHEFRIFVNREGHAASLRIGDPRELSDIAVIGALNTYFGNSKVRYKRCEGGRVELISYEDDPDYDRPDPPRNNALDQDDPFGKSAQGH